MELDTKQILSILAQKGVTALYHANSVRTSCSFLSAGKLLSRGTVEQYELSQTPQKSDTIDQKYGVWFDLFLDAVDIHSTANTCNWYGPVLFVLDLEFLKSIPTICVTRQDPLKWHDTDQPYDRFIQTVKEFDEMYVPGDFDKMFVIRCTGGSLPLHGALKEIILDDLKFEQDNRLYSNACDALRTSADRSGLRDFVISPRVCRSDCRCHETYRNDRERTHALFNP
jgi:hypothetical protein